MLNKGVLGDFESKITRSLAEGASGGIKKTVDDIIRGPSFLSQEQLQKINRREGFGRERGIEIDGLFIRGTSYMATKSFSELGTEDWHKVFELLGLEVNIEERDGLDIHISMSFEDMKKFDEFMEFYFGRDVSKAIMGSYNVKTRIARRDGTYYGLCYCF